MSILSGEVKIQAPTITLGITPPILRPVGETFFSLGYIVVKYDTLFQHLEMSQIS